MMDEAIQSKIITAVKETAQLISAKLYYPGITDKEVSQ